MKDLTPLLGPRDLAQILGVKLGTVYSWMSRKVPLPPCVKISGTTRWRESTVLKWIEARENKKRRKNFEDE